MKISHSPYRLELNENFYQLDGSLLKVEFDDGIVGYSDLLVWPRFGHRELAVQLKSLVNESALKEAQIALNWAKVDASFRGAGKSVKTEGLVAVHSHGLIHSFQNLNEVFLESAMSRGFTTFKLKANTNIPLAVMTARLELIAKVVKCRWRLDFNFSMDQKSFMKWWQDLSTELQEQIEIIEDAFPYEPEAWLQCRRDGLPMVADWVDMRFVEPSTVSHVVYKPNYQRFDEIEAFRETSVQLLVTHGMTHKLGRSQAAFAASQLAESWGWSRVHAGLVDATAARPYFEIIDGMGFGFDQELEQRNWESIN